MDGTTSYWPTNRGRELEDGLHAEFKALVRSRDNSTTNATRSTAQANAARSRARQSNPAATDAELVALFAAIDLDEKLFPCNLLKDVSEDNPDESSLKGGIEGKCARKFLNKTSHEALMCSPCATCFETKFQSDMKNIDCSESMPLTLFAVLKDEGVWSQKANFEFSPTFADLNGSSL